MKPSAVIKKIKQRARAAGLEFELTQRTRHLGIRVGKKRTTLGRHSETSNLMAEQVYKQLESELGKDWWR